MRKMLKHHRWNIFSFMHNLSWTNLKMILWQFYFCWGCIFFKFCFKKPHTRENGWQKDSFIFLKDVGSIFFWIFFFFNVCQVHYWIAALLRYYTSIKYYHHQLSSSSWPLLPPFFLTDRQELKNAGVNFIKDTWSHTHVPKQTAAHTSIIFFLDAGLSRTFLCGTPHSRIYFWCVAFVCII